MQFLSNDDGSLETESNKMKRKKKKTKNGERLKGQTLEERDPDLENNARNLKTQTPDLLVHK